ncbi:hypothetical protein HZA42_02625 [Candidatus Peregrinibacteria bacterium]|nr:hypothetical protein [Candidatus Peregrinibacteria bacterium]
MQNKERIQILNHIFFTIVVIAVPTIVFIVINQIVLMHLDWSRTGLAILLVLIPLALQAFIAAGLLYHWFYRWDWHTGTIVDTVQWIAGIQGITALFDFIIRLMRRSPWMMSGYAPFAIDAAFVMIFVLWISISYVLNRHVNSGNECEFCRLK